MHTCPNTVDDDRRESEDDSDDDNGGMDYNHGQYRDPIDDEKLERELEARRRALIRYDHQRQQLIFLLAQRKLLFWFRFLGRELDLGFFTEYRRC